MNDPIVIRFGGYQKPASVHTRAAVHFGEALKKKVGDLVDFQLVGDVLSLGRQSGDLPLMVESGELSMCYISSVRFTQAVPEFKLLELPFLITEREPMHRAFSGELGDLLKHRVRESTAFRLLGVWDNGFRHLSNKIRPICSPVDCRGLRIRTQMSEIHVESLRAMGFVPVPVDVKEFVEKIAGDTFDAQDNPLTNTYNFGVHKYHRYITLSSHFFGATGLICNEAHFRGWPQELQAAVEEAGREATLLQWRLAAAEDANILEKLKATDTEIVHLSDSERAAFKDSVCSVLAKYRREFDDSLFNRLIA